jgi:hypothetical protein
LQLGLGAPHRKSVRFCWLISLSGNRVGPLADPVAKVVTRNTACVWEGFDTSRSLGAREHLGGELTITLLRGIGEGFEVHEIREDLVIASIDWLRCRQQGLWKSV